MHNLLRLPDDVWLVDLDSNKLTPARVDNDIPALPEPEGTILKNHLKQVWPNFRKFFFRKFFLLEFSAKVLCFDFEILQVFVPIQLKHHLFFKSIHFNNHQIIPISMYFSISVFLMANFFGPFDVYFLI